MYLVRIFATLILLLLLIGCASTFTSIETTDDPNVYYVTETHMRFLAPPDGTLFKCSADGMRMNCDKMSD